MKTRFMATVLFCLASLNCVLFAQPNNEKRKADFEKFKAEREAFINKAMDLTEEEAKVFWPVCNELQAKKFELNRTLREEIRKIRQAKREGQTVSEADYKKVIELSASVKVKEAQLDEEYMDKFLKVLPGEKVFSYQRAEQQFANEMFGKRTRKGK
jgi:Spy/CpxP family protein refolding chaperone